METSAAFVTWPGLTLSLAVSMAWNLAVWQLRRHRAGQR
jgi:hypothetical protein